MSLSHSTTYSPKPLLTEGFSPPAEHHSSGRVANYPSPLISHANRFFHRQPKERGTSAIDPFTSPPALQNFSWHLAAFPTLRSQTQVNHLSQLKETTKH